jgi:hypothetical protein
VSEPAPQSLIAILKELGTRVRDAEREKVFAEVEARVAELLRVAGRQTPDTHGSEGENAHRTVFTVSSPEGRPGQIRWVRCAGGLQDVMHFQIIMDTGR